MKENYEKRFVEIQELIFENYFLHFNIIMEYSLY